jgi:hypothetical protein
MNMYHIESSLRAAVEFSRLLSKFPWSYSVTSKYNGLIYQPHTDETTSFKDVNVVTGKAHAHTRVIHLIPRT